MLSIDQIRAAVDAWADVSKAMEAFVAKMRELPVEVPTDATEPEPKRPPTLTCVVCGKETPRLSSQQRACPDCKPEVERQRHARNRKLSGNSVTCKICGTVVPKLHGNQTTCLSEECRLASTRQNYRRKDSKARRVDVWQRSVPEYAPMLPGRLVPMTLAGRVHKPFDLGNMRLFHAFVTNAIKLPHDELQPGFSLLVGDEQISVYLPDDSWRRLDGKVVDGRIGPVQVTAKWGPAQEIRTPVVQPGRHKLRLNLITPLIITTSGRRVPMLDVTADHIRSTLRTTLAPRLGANLVTEDLAIEVASVDTQVVSVQLGGKEQCLRGPTGTVDLECNAPVRWLLECAAAGLGLGGRTAFGFGRVSVCELG